MTQVQKTFESNKADFERLKELINSEGAFTELRFTTGPGFPDLPENTANSEIKKLFEKLGVFQVERGGGLTKFSFHNTYSTSMFGWNDVGLCYAVSVNVDYRALMHGRYFSVYGIAPNWGVYQTSDSGFL